MNTALAQVVPEDIEPKRQMPRSTGRPTKMTKEVIAKLESAYSVGANDTQACFIAGISEDTLRRYIAKNPMFAIRKKGLEQMLAFKAKASLDKHIPKDGKLALDVIERLEKDKWSLRTEVTGNDGQPLSFTFVPPSDGR